MVRQPMRFGSPAGFTLVELLLVLVILAVMTTVTLPYVGRSHDGLKLEQEVRNLSDAIRYATRRAEGASQPIRVLVDTASGCYSLQMAASEEDEYVPIDDPIGALRRLDPKVRVADMQGFEATGEGLHYLSLDPRKPWPEASLDLSAGDLIKRVRIIGKLVEVEDVAAP